MPEAKGPVDITFFVAVNEDGDFSVCSDESDALETLANEQGGYNARVIAVTLKGVELPRTVAVEIQAPAEFAAQALEAAVE
jgi:hypothetical protein